MALSLNNCLNPSVMYHIPVHVCRYTNTLIYKHIQLDNMAQCIVHVTMCRTFNLKKKCQINFVEDIRLCWVLKIIYIYINYNIINMACHFL